MEVTQVTQQMLEAAMKKAAETNLLPRRAVPVEVYLKRWDAMRQVIQAALDAAAW